MSKNNLLGGSNNRIAERDYYEIRGSVYNSIPSIDGYRPRLILCPLRAAQESQANDADCLNCLQQRRNRRRRRVIDLAFVCVSLTTSAWLLALFLFEGPNVPTHAIVFGLLLQTTCMTRFAFRAWRRRFL